MKIKKIVELLKGKIVCGDDKADIELQNGFASDLMSDVLTIGTDNLLLITGLANLQTIRTTEMLDIPFIVFVRGKKATDEMLKLANENEMVLIECNYSMFKVCGILYEVGIKPVY